MEDHNNFQRFLDAQAGSYATALAEIRSGKKKSHWMWYIFPQIAGLGFSDTTKFYAIKDLREAQAYLQHPVLGTRLKEITNELLQLESRDASGIFGSPDNVKLKSSMTLFAALPHPDQVFQEVLDKFFGGSLDTRTLKILSK
jgi:uncharacterized protein (DUF1810 family)